MGSVATIWAWGLVGGVAAGVDGHDLLPVVTRLGHVALLEACAASVW